MTYVDGFVLPVPTKNLAAYRAMARKAGRVWKEHGALLYMECAGDDLKVPMGLSFPKLAKPKKGETVVFSFIVYKSKASRNAVLKKVMQDKRITATMTQKMPFDMTRMSYGGFKVMVDL